MSLNTRPMVSPTIVNGNSTSHIKGNRINITNARGQQVTNKRHKRIRAMKVLMKLG